MAGNWLQELVYRDKFRSLFREDFQHWVDGLLKELHGSGSYESIRQTRGDGGLDGIVIGEGLVYQIYSPAEMRDSRTAKKIEEDFRTAHAQLGDSLRQWLFLHNHPEGKIGKDTAAQLLRLQKEHPKVVIGTLNINSLWDRLQRLPLDVVSRLFGLPRLAPFPKRLLPAFVAAWCVFGGLLAALAAHTSLGRRGFRDLTFAKESLEWGIRSLIPISVTLAAILMVGFLAVIVAKGALAFVTRREDGLTRHLIRRASLSFLSAPHGPTAMLMATVNTLVLVATLLFYWPLLRAVMSTVNDTPEAILLPLSPANASQHQLFQFLIILVIDTSILLFARSGVLIGGIRREAQTAVATTCLVAAIASFVFLISYVVLNHSEYQKAEYRGRQCHAIEENDRHVLLTCSGAVPRNVWLRHSETGSIQWLNFEDNIFAWLVK